MSHVKHTCQNLKQSFQLHSFGKTNEVRDSAAGNRVVFSGTYRQCVAYCKKIGVWYS
jgi:hypothetical protein